LSEFLEVRLPPYEAPRNTWRAKIHAAASEAMRSSGIVYSEADRLEVDVQLVMTEAMLQFHDVDNRLKDILDALQARVGGPKKVRRLTPLVPNDFQIVRASVEKVAGEVLGGRLTVRRIDGAGR
jgi:Holliday junction resolvase RusA-like endonuclease